MRYRPLYTYGFSGSEVELLLSLPQTWWTPEEGIALGHESISAAGIPISEWMRYDQAVLQRIRFTDDEYVAVMTMVEWIMRRKHVPVVMRLEYNNAATEYEVYLESPSKTNRAVPTRDTNDPSVWLLNLLWRSTDGTRIHLGVFDEIVGEFEATGGTITEVDGYRIHTFTADGSFEVLAGSRDDIEILMVGGGGKGGDAGTTFGVYTGGGGGGRVRHLTDQTLSEGVFPVVIGAGQTSSLQNRGGSTTFNGETAEGGGEGSTVSVNGKDGGSGGGGSSTSSGNRPGGAAIYGAMGFAGGNGGTGLTQGGGGGGATQAGGSAATTAKGGDGYTTDISGANVTYGGGGGGRNGAGGSGGGGAGTLNGGQAGTANRGGGGGGSQYTIGVGAPGGNGGSGIVIIRYPIS